MKYRAPRQVAGCFVGEVSGASDCTNDLNPMERTGTIKWDDPSKGMEAVVSMTGIEWLRAMARTDAPWPLLSGALGFKLETIEEGHVVVTLAPAEFHYNPVGSLHGGIVGTLFDSSLDATGTFLITRTDALPA